MKRKTAVVVGVAIIIDDRVAQSWSVLVVLFTVWLQRQGFIGVVEGGGASKSRMFTRVKQPTSCSHSESVAVKVKVAHELGGVDCVDEGGGGCRVQMSVPS